jgi:hypothetical protein
MNFLPASIVVSSIKPRHFQVKLFNMSPLIAHLKEWMQCGLALALLMGGVAGFLSGARGATSADQTINLTATLISPIDIKLDWQDSSPNATGHIVEYASDPNGPYIILGFFPPSHTSYTHPRLMPGTTFYYRVRPYYGPTSNQVEVIFPKELSEATYTSKYDNSEDYSWANPKTVPEVVPIPKVSIRNAAASTDGAPTDLKAVLVSKTVSGFQLTWTVHSSDEEGFLLESKDEVSPEFQVCALIAPKSNAFGWGLHPPQRKAAFRLRAFYYGSPSNIVRKSTVQPADWKDPSAPSKPGN